MQLTELQTYSLTHKSNMPFASASSEDHSFAFITEKGVDILELTPDPKSVSPSLTCRRHFIKTPPDIATAELGIDPTDLLPYLQRSDIFALITDVDVSPNLKKTQPPTPIPKVVVWSPLGILQNQRCILSVVTTTGSLTLHELFSQEMCQRASISSLWLRHCKKSWRKQPKDVMKKFKELKLRAEQVKITATCWLDETVSGSGYLAAASKSGSVSLWQVRASGANPADYDIKLVWDFESQLRIITAINWISLGSGKNILTLGSLDGRIKCFTLTNITSSNTTSNSLGTGPVSDPPLVATASQEVWSDADRISPAQLSVRMWRDGLLLIAVKGPFFIALYLDHSAQRLANATFRSCDASINGMSQLSEDEIMMVTRSCRLSRLSFSLTADTKLTLSVDDVESFVNIAHMGCYGLHITRNNVICCIFLSVNQSYDHLRLREPSQVVCCSLMEPQELLSSPEKPVSDLWDCLELLRVNTLQRSVVAEISYPPSVLDSMTLDQLTIALWWVSFATSAEEDEVKRQQLQSLRGDIETLVISSHFFKRIALMLSTTPENLSSFQLESLILLRKWLTRLQSLSEEYTTTQITAKTLLQQLVALKARCIPVNELCKICGSLVSDLNDVLYSECSKGHRLPRCSLSLVQCYQLPYYSCAQCGALAHSEAVEECGITCILCGGVLRKDEDILFND